MSQGVSSPVATLAGNAVGSRIEAPIRRKAKRTVSKYQKRFGVELKRLKKKHPRTPISGLMKRAHSATKRALK